MAFNITKEQMLEAIQNSQGLVSKIQQKLSNIIKKPIGWDTTKRFIEKWPECQEAINAEKEAMLDLAENNVFKDLVRGEISTSKWYLKMKGKDRGYVETQEIQMAGTDPLNINLTGATETADALRDSNMVELGNADETD